MTLDIGSGKVVLGLGTGPAMYGETPLPASGHVRDPAGTMVLSIQDG